MMWFTYRTPFSDQQMVLCQIDDNTVISGRADSVYEYIAWLAEGNTPEPWDNQ